MSRGCVFCAIAAGDAARSVVHEDDLVIACMDIHPVNPGHLLVLPKHHVAWLGDLPLDTGRHMMEVGMRLNAAIRASPLRAAGTNLFLADGEAAGQEILHTHLHVIPRFPGDGFALRIHYDPPPHRSTLDRQAAVIATALHDLGAGPHDPGAGAPGRGLPPR